MNIKTIPVEPGGLKPKPDADTTLGFGTRFTDYMFIMYYEKDKGWFDPAIKKFENISLSPASLVFHYGQEIFEGLKAYLRVDGKIGLFRADQNFMRLNKSARRLVMPEVPVETQRKALHELLKLERDWFPNGKGESMYIRPTMIATQDVLGVKDSATYIFYIILSPSGAYYSKGFKPVRVLVEDHYIRAAIGGVGTAKTGGNYAASLLAGKKAQEKNCDQVLWLDAKEHKYVEEVGAMNICFVINGKIVTSELDGAILEGVTRDSLLQLAPTLGYDIEERKISIDEIVESAKSGKLTECFGCGTAAVVSPVGELLYKNELVKISDEPGSVSVHLYDELTGIQYGRKEDRFGWTTIVG
ncbi:branched-chain amino acid aminotransferase [candidate division KSB1 bacterium]